MVLKVGNRTHFLSGFGPDKTTISAEILSFLCRLMNFYGKDQVIQGLKSYQSLIGIVNLTPIQNLRLNAF